MKNLRTLLVTFSNDLGAAPISAFRGAVIEKVGRENPLFHNHLGNEGFIYKYPLIQYKKLGRQPAIFCLDAGVEEIHKLFEQRNWTIDLQGEKLALKVDRLDMKTTNLNIWEKNFEYNLWNWQALNEENWPRYLQLESMVEKIAMLEKILTANILSFAKGIDWHIDKPVKVIIKDVKLERDSRMKDIKVRTFEVDFRSNVFLPDFMGLGKGVSKGFGTVRKLRNQY
ncbi:MAG: CRISPR-associated endonuclease Cas6 [Bacteroidota bacterium]